MLLTEIACRIPLFARLINFSPTDLSSSLELVAYHPVLPGSFSVGIDLLILIECSPIEPKTWVVNLNLINIRDGTSGRRCVTVSEVSEAHGDKIRVWGIADGLRLVTAPKEVLKRDVRRLRWRSHRCIWVSSWSNDVNQTGRLWSVFFLLDLSIDLINIKFLRAFGFSARRLFFSIHGLSTRGFNIIDLTDQRLVVAPVTRQRYFIIVLGIPTDELGDLILAGVYLFSGLSRLLILLELQPLIF